jgi:hypothetical protein
MSGFQRAQTIYDAISTAAPAPDATTGSRNITPTIFLKETVLRATALIDQMVAHAI